MVGVAARRRQEAHPRALHARQRQHVVVEQRVTPLHREPSPSERHDLGHSRAHDDTVGNLDRAVIGPVAKETRRHFAPRDASFRRVRPPFCAPLGPRGRRSRGAGQARGGPRGGRRGEHGARAARRAREAGARAGRARGAGAGAARGAGLTASQRDTGSTSDLDCHVDLPRQVNVTTLSAWESSVTLTCTHALEGRARRAGGGHGAQAAGAARRRRARRAGGGHGAQARARRAGGAGAARGRARARRAGQARARRAGGPGTGRGRRSTARSGQARAAAARRGVAGRGTSRRRDVRRAGSLRRLLAADQLTLTLATSATRTAPSG